MGVTASTPANLVIGAGDAYLDGSDVGATMDANSYNIEQEWTVPELNGVPGELMGTRYKRREMARLGMRLPEISSAKLLAVWPGAQSATDGNVITVDTDGTRRIPTADYHDWQLRVPGLDGKRFDFLADNGINEAGLDMEASDDGTLAIPVEIMSTWNAADMDASPHRILIITGVSS